MPEKNFPGITKECFVGECWHIKRNKFPITPFFVAYKVALMLASDNEVNLFCFGTEPDD